MSNESVPIGNVIHVGLTSGMKSDPISEIAEYFIQEREEDLFKAILDFLSRERRYGKISEQVNS